MRTRKWVSAAAITSALVIAAVGDARADVQGWTIVGSENLPGGLRAGLFASACVSASDCWAVGEQRSATDYSAPLAEHWDGTAWSIATTPKPFATLNATLYALACPSTTSCWATGLLSVTGGGSAPLVEHWDGAAWTISDVPLPSGEQFGGLRGVTCASTTDCWAVGWWNGGGGSETLIEHWDSTAWTIVVSPPVSASAFPALNDVACSSSAACWAVGSYTPAASPQALIEHWDGTSWTLSTPAAPPATAQSADLTGVTCASATLCMAVGAYSITGTGTSQALIEAWSGTAWSTSTPSDASPATAAALEHVTCTSSVQCYAAGYATPPGGATTALVDTWSGGSWSSAGTVGPPGAKSSQLSTLSCAAGVCWSVGSQVTSAGFDTALVEQLSAGTWSEGAAQVPQGQEVNALTAVACAAGPVCFAVGSHSTEAAAQTLVETSTGGVWSAVASPSAASGMNSFLNGVACVSASDCWAVGGAEPNTNGISPTDINTSTTLIESWNGSDWSIIASPNPTGAQISTLLGVSCASATDCWAVGLWYPVANNGVTIGLNSTGPIAIAQTLVEQWNGQSWSVVSSPNVSPGMSDELTSVTCVSAVDCWASGAAEGTQTVQGLVEHWDGSSWAIVPSPQTAGNESNGLLGVACADASSCWAAGYSYLGSGGGARDFQTWVERWDGNAWSTVATPNVGADHVDALFALTCVSALDCRAVGTYGNGPIYATLALQWDGGGWNVASSQEPATSQGATLNGVACTAGAACSAAGGFNTNDGTLQTLVEQTGGTPGPAVPEVPWPWLLLGVAIPAVAIRSRRRWSPSR